MSEDTPADKNRPRRRTGDIMRLDLVRQVVSLDGETAMLVASPDPRRYDRIERDEPGTWFIDRYLHIAFRMEDFAESSMEGLPFYASERTIESASEYAAERRTALAAEPKTGEYVAPQQEAKPHAPLETAGEERDVAFISVDICGSTAYQRRDPKGFSTASRILLQELGGAVGQFQGAILKVTGDGFIAYLDFPGFTVLVDSTIDLGGSMLRILQDAVNPAIEAAGLQALSIRVGADYGPAIVNELAVPITGFATRDVVSDALNRAVKIEQSCAPNTFRIGYYLYRLAHVQWLERCREVPFDSDEIGISGYQVFEVH